ncbi:MAG: hypothetical protein ACR2OO_04025 [Thermomicrobiales bacterium]
MADKTNVPNSPAPAAPAAPAPAPAPVVNVMIQQPDRAAEGARAMAEGRALNMDTASQPGGVYIVNGREVNANGEKVGSSLDRSST